MNPREELWEGKRISPHEAKGYYGVDNAYCLSDLATCLDNYLKIEMPTAPEPKNIAIWYDYDKSTNESIHRVMENLKKHVSENHRNKWITQSPM